MSKTYTLAHVVWALFWYTVTLTGIEGIEANGGGWLWLGSVILGGVAFGLQFLLLAQDIRDL
jgi:hypothetical protein